MKVVDTRTTTVTYESLGDPALDAILAEIAVLRTSLTEGKAGRSKAEAKAAKDKNRQRQALKSKKRGGGYDAEKAKEVVKKDTEGGKKKVNPKNFKSSTSFENSTPDALLHDKKTREDIPASEFANPKKKTGPLKRSRSSVAGTYRQELEHGTPDEIAKAAAAMRSMGMEPQGKLAKDRDGCTPGSANYSARRCKPHGPGGPDEWLRRKTSHKSDKSHRGETRSKSFAGHAKMPKATPTKTQKGGKSTELAHAQAGGHHGERERGFFRTLGPATLKKLGAGEKTQGNVGSPLSGSKFRTLQKRNKAMQVKS